MKRKITKIFALLLVCCAFMLAGCGDNSVNVNVDGDYQDSTTEAFTTYVAQVDEDEKLEASGYQFTLKTDMTGDVETHIVMNGKIIKTKDGETEKITASFNTKSTIIVQGSKQELEMNSYIVDNVFYTEVAGIKVKESIENAYNEDGIGQILSMIPNKADIDLMIEQYTKMGNVAIKIAENGDTVKYLISVSSVSTSGENMGNSDMYYVFKNGALEGIKISGTMTMGETSQTVSIDMQTYNGEIDLPSLDGYIEA